MSSALIRFAMHDWRQSEARIEVLEAEVARLRAALSDAADELDAYYRAEYPGDHPVNKKRLAQAMAANPGRVALTAEAEDLPPSPS